MLNNLFRLDGTPAIHLPGAPAPNLSPGNTVENVEFRHPCWPSPVQKVRNVEFRNVGLSKTTLERLTFLDCTFEDCLFIATTFHDVEFHNCVFRNCTFWKAKFEAVYLDPECIELSERYRVDAANTGVSLFQSLLNNFDDQRQNEFYQHADMRFRRWKRYQLSYDRRNGHIGRWRCAKRWWASLIYEVVAGFGYKPIRFFFATLVLFLAVSFFNYSMIGASVLVGGQRAGHVTFADSVFYTYSVMTVLGFSSIIPVTPWAKIVTVGEALIATGWLGIFVSLLVKRFLR